MLKPCPNPQYPKARDNTHKIADNISTGFIHAGSLMIWLLPADSNLDKAKSAGFQDNRTSLRLRAAYGPNFVCPDLDTGRPANRLDQMRHRRKSHLHIRTTWNAPFSRHPPQPSWRLFFASP